MMVIIDEARNKTYLRVLWIVPDLLGFYYINAASKSGMPRYISRVEYESYSSDGTLVVQVREEQGYGKELEKVNGGMPFITPLLDSTIIEMKSKVNVHHNFDKERSSMEEAWQSIEKILAYGPETYFDPALRGGLIRQVALDAGVTEKTIRSWLRRYWQRGQVKVALMPNYKGRGHPHSARQVGSKKLGRPPSKTKIAGSTSGVNVVGEVKDSLHKGINRYYIIGKMGLEDAYQATIEDYFSSEECVDGLIFPAPWRADLRPTKGQSLYWAKKTKYGNLSSNLKKMMGESEYGRNLRPQLNSGIHKILSPGAVYLGDGAIVPIHLINSIDPACINKKPRIYLFMDAFSGKWVGMFATYENLSYQVALLALHNAASDKSDFLARYSAPPGSWNCHHFPVAIHVDGGEFKGEQKENLTSSLGLGFIQDPPYRPDLKGVIEGAIGILKAKLKSQIAGSEKKKRRIPGERNYKLDACFTLDQFIEALVGAILFYNKHHKLSESRFFDGQMIADGVRPYPDQLWEWGLKNRPPATQYRTGTELAYHLLPRSEAKVTASGIYFKKNYYWLHRGDDEQWWGHARERDNRTGNKGKPKYVKIAYDPWCVDRIFLVTEGQGKIEPCSLVQRDSQFISSSFSDYDNWFEDYNEKFEPEEDEKRKDLAVMHAKFKRISEKAIVRNGIYRGEFSKKRLKTINMNAQKSESVSRRRVDSLSTHIKSDTNMKKTDELVFTGNTDKKTVRTPTPDYANVLKNLRPDE